MENNTENIRQETVESDDSVVRTTEVQTTKTADGTPIAERIIWFIVSIIVALLAIRFIFALLGANESNGFANFIYTASSIFIAPFTTLFNYEDFLDGVSRFEGYTIVAMIVYVLVGAGLGRLVTIARR